MKMRNSGVAVVTAVLLVMGSCSAADTQVTSTTVVASTASSSPRSTTTSSSTTTQVPSGATRDDIVLARYLASLYEIDADVAEDQAGPVVSDDMQYEIATLESAVARIRELDPPLSAQQLQQGSIDVNVRFADVFRSFAEIDATATEATANELLSAAMGEVSAVARDMLAVRAQRNGMAITVLAAQVDDPDARFIVQMLTIEAKAAPATDSVLVIVSQMFANPDVGIAQLAAAIADFASIVDAWREVEAPPRFENLRRRSEEVLSAALSLVSEILDDAQAGEGSTDDAAAVAMAVDLSTLRLKTQLLEIERARAVAGVLRELSE